VADPVCFIASERAAFINGKNIRIDGGVLDIAHQGSNQLVARNRVITRPLLIIINAFCQSLS
jgi:hypothetical protein